MTYAERVMIDILGGIPRGQLFGMPVLEVPDMPNDRIRFVDRRTGNFSDFQIPSGGSSG